MATIGDVIKFVPDHAFADNDPTIRSGTLYYDKCFFGRMSVTFAGDSTPSIVDKKKCVNITEGETVAGYIAARDA